MGGPTAFARLIDVSVDAALKMSSRNTVHSDHWQKIVARAPRAGVSGVTMEYLGSLKRGRPRAAKAAQEANQVAV